MIAILTCKCASALPKARKFLQEGGVEDWIEIPIYEGKHSAKQFISSLPDGLNAYPSLDALTNMINTVGRFIVILGYDDEELSWADIGHGDTKGKIDAELILERFA